MDVKGPDPRTVIPKANKTVTFHASMSKVASGITYVRWSMVWPFWCNRCCTPHIVLSAASAHGDVDTTSL